MTEKRERPFSCGTQFADWVSANCDRCTHSKKCDIVNALSEAFWGDGSVSIEIAKRMGCESPETRFQWKCGEWEPTEEWKAEWAKKHPVEEA